MLTILLPLTNGLPFANLGLQPKVLDSQYFIYLNTTFRSKMSVMTLAV